MALLNSLLSQERWIIFGLGDPKINELDQHFKCFVEYNLKLSCPSKKSENRESKSAHRLSNLVSRKMHFLFEVNKRTIHVHKFFQIIEEFPKKVIRAAKA